MSKRGDERGERRGATRARRAERRRKGGGERGVVDDGGARRRGAVALQLAQRLYHAEKKLQAALHTVVREERDERARE